jgi:hypothetical protein
MIALILVPLQSFNSLLGPSCLFRSGRLDVTTLHAYSLRTRTYDTMIHLQSEVIVQPFTSCHTCIYTFLRCEWGQSLFPSSSLASLLRLIVIIILHPSLAQITQCKYIISNNYDSFNGQMRAKSVDILHCSRCNTGVMDCTYMKLFVHRHGSFFLLA